MVLREIQDRYSIRKYTDQIPDDNLIDEILEAARLAPSWVNVQPWHFIVIKDKKTKELLSKLSYDQPHVAQAPVVIACCGDISAWESEKIRKILETRPGITQERINSLLDQPSFNPNLIGKEAIIFRTLEELTYSIAYMTLEIEKLGLGACIIGRMGNELTGSLPEVYTKVREILELPDHLMLMTLLTIGYPDLSIKKPKKIRKKPEEVISYEKYGKKRK